MALLAPVPLVNVAELGPVHFIAIGGAGMSGIASLYAELGVPVSGSDQTDSAALAALAAQGIACFVGHDAAQLGDAETVVVSSAIRETNPELVEARRRGLRVWHRSAALAALMLQRRGVAVGGTHGKTTTTAMLATILTGAWADPSYVIGAPLASSGRSSHLGGGEAFVVEADESDGSFLQYPAQIAVITNIEADHLDNWSDAQSYAEGFFAFATADSVESVVINADDAGARALLERLDARQGSPEGTNRPRTVSFGEDPGADLVLSDISAHGTSISASASWRGEQSEPITVGSPGRHNLANAAAAYASARLLGVDGASARTALAAFGGTLRRFQLVGAVNGIEIFDDYAHHPTEIAATLSAARIAAGERRVVACFQPHLYSRTRDNAYEFGQALAAADVVLVLGIYPAREEPIAGVSSELVVQAATSASTASVHSCPDVADAAAVLAGLVSPGDMVLTLGAGDVTTVGPQLVHALAGQR